MQGPVATSGAQTPPPNASMSTVYAMPSGTHSDLVGASIADSSLMTCEAEL